MNKYINKRIILIGIIVLITFISGIFGFISHSLLKLEPTEGGGGEIKVTTLSFETNDGFRFNYPAILLNSTFYPNGNRVVFTTSLNEDTRLVGAPDYMFSVVFENKTDFIKNTDDLLKKGTWLPQFYKYIESKKVQINGQKFIKAEFLQCEDIECNKTGSMPNIYVFERSNQYVVFMPSVDNEYFLEKEILSTVSER